MRLRDTRLGMAEAILVSVTVAVGWVVVVPQLRNDGWISGGGTAWLLTMALIASAGALVAVMSRRAGRHGWVALGLFAVAVSPTVFAYILNALVIALTVTELVLATRQLNRRSMPAH